MCDASNTMNVSGTNLSQLECVRIFSRLRSGNGGMR